MKKLVITVLLLPLIAAISLLTGCTKPYENDKKDKDWQSIGGATAVRIVTIEGHKYLVTRYIESVSTIHAASCPCCQH